MRLCHSVWTKPIIDSGLGFQSKIESNLWLFSLSIAYAKLLDATIVLHTDSLGAKLFGYLPYDEIYLTLDNLETPSCFWAAGKIHAQSLEPLGSIHLDGDVFLKKKGLLDILNFENYDVLIQNTESNNQIYDPLLVKFKEVLLSHTLPEELNFNSQLAFNCGIIGFNNKLIKEKYVDGYQNLVNVCILDESFMKFLSTNKSFIPDLILEQWWLKCITNYYPCNVKALLPNLSTLQEDAIKIGFTHLLGKKKYDLIDKVKERLLEVNPEIYENTKNKMSNLKDFEITNI